MMPSIAKYILSSMLIAVSSTYAADTDQYYVRLTQETKDTEGMITTFPKAVLKDIGLIHDLVEAFPAYGTQEKPLTFTLHEISLDNLDEVVKLIEQVEDLVTKNPDKNTVDGIAEFIWRTLSLGNYDYIARILRIGDYLRISPTIINALKQCIINPYFKKTIEESHYTLPTTDEALKAGLKEINKLPEPLLLSIKNHILRSISVECEELINRLISSNTFKFEENRCTMPQEIINNLQNVPQHKIVIKYDPYRSRFICWSNSNPYILFYIEKESDKNNLITVKIFPFPKFDFLYQIKSPFFFQFIDQNIDPKKIGVVNLSYGVHIHSLPGYTVLSTSCCNQKFLETQNNRHEITDITYLFSNTGNFWAIPGKVQYIGVCKDIADKYKFVFRLETFDSSKRIVIMDALSGNVEYNSSIPQFVNIIAGCTYKSLYITCFTDNTYSPQNTYFHILDLTGKEQTFPITNNISYDVILPSSMDDTTLEIIAVSKDNKVIDIYQLDRKKITILRRHRVNKYIGSLATATKQLPSNVFSVNTSHPQIKDLEQPLLFENNNGCFVAGLDKEKKEFIVVTYWTKSAIDLLKKINKLTDLSIEQLYMLNSIAYNFLYGTAYQLTPTEKLLFESMKVNDQNLFDEIFSANGKPSTHPTERQFIVNPAKTGEYTTPLPQYIEQQPTSKKRPAEESSEMQPPTKKKRIENGDEESFSDESTLDESEDNE